MTTSHQHARAIHARRRAEERYGFQMDKLALASLRSRIIAVLCGMEDPGCVLLDRTNEQLTRWALWHGGEWVPLVYDEEMACVVTFLPSGMLRKHKRKLPW